MVEAYVRALEKRDCPSVTSLSNETLQSSASCIDGLLPPPDADVSFGTPTMVDTTVAEAPVRMDDRRTTATFMLIQESAGWKVSKVEIR